MARLLLALGLLLVLSAGAAAAADLRFPPLTGRVVDEAGLLAPARTLELTQMLAAHETTTGQQVVVAIVASLQGRDIEDYGYRLGRTWGIGDKDRNTGVILLVAPNERRVRIEVGYGLEGTLTDAMCADIIDRIILPAFRRGDMDGGIVDGTTALLKVLGGNPGSASAGTAPPVPSAPESAPSHPGIATLLLALVLFVIIGRLLTRGSSARGIGLLGGLMLQSWGGGEAEGSAGALFSGGGGSFGGGGASGSW